MVANDAPQRGIGGKTKVSTNVIYVMHKIRASLPEFRIQRLLGGEHTPEPLLCIVHHPLTLCQQLSQWKHAPPPLPHQIAVEQDVFERRLERLHANAVLGNPDGEENETTDGFVEVNEDEQTPQTGKQGAHTGGASQSPKEDRQARGGGEPSPRGAKEKKKSPAVKKSKAQQVQQTGVVFVCIQVA